MQTDCFKIVLASIFFLLAVNSQRVDWETRLKQIQSEAKTWKAVEPRAQDLRRSFHGFLPINATSLQWQRRFQNLKLPVSYDVREKFPYCTSMKRIRDQCGCGSCFAFGAIEAFEDRICIQKKQNVTLSVEDIISCHVDENMSCDGGNPITVWENIFAGKQSNDGAILDSCYPYEIRPCPCNHHSPDSTLPTCTPEETMLQQDTPTCDLMKKFSCQDKGIFKAGPPTLIPDVNMEAEIFVNGPITAAFTVYDDFLTYKSGIYHVTPSAKPLGGHTIKIIGYGTEDGIDYWIVANSWNSEWGDNGFFKIIRGKDECHIESLAVVAGNPV